MLKIFSARISARMDTSDYGLSILKPNYLVWQIFCKSTVILDVVHYFNMSRQWTAWSTLVRHSDVRR
jgi:hypothetical protein